jgi:CheY-like chemotaxis protein
MITGSAAEFGGVQASADAVLNKPFGLEELRRAVAQFFQPAHT